MFLKQCWRSCWAHENRNEKRGQAITVRAFPAELLRRGHSIEKIRISLLSRFYWTGLERGRTCLQRIRKDRSGSAVMTFHETSRVQKTKTIVYFVAKTIWYYFFLIDYTWRMHRLAIDISWIHRFFIDAIRRYN